MIGVILDDGLNAFGCIRIANAVIKWANKKGNFAGPTKWSQSICDHWLFQVPRKLESESSDIIWSGDAWICSRELMHYPAFRRNGVTVSVYSFAYIMGEGQVQYLAYLEDLYEDKRGLKKVKVRWFHHNQEVEDLSCQLNVHPREVFITPHIQVVSAECIDGVALVFTPKDYENYMSRHPHSSLGVHMCHREFRNNKVKFFSVSKMRGYSNQAAFSYHVSQHNMVIHKSNEEGKESDKEDLARQGSKRMRSFRGNRKLAEGQSGFANSVPQDQITKCEPTHQKLKIQLSSKGAIGIKLVGPELQCQSSFRVGENVELLSQDSGMRGCWFRCKILQVSQKRLKVQYFDVEDAEKTGKLKEWVPASRVTAPDRLGMRHAGRLTVRPWPPKGSSGFAVETGSSVDAWWCDGWWEGVITGIEISSDRVHVYFPGENRILTFQRRYLRISRDWVDHKWVEIKPNTDILTLIVSTMRANKKPSRDSSFAEGSGSALEDCKVLASPNVRKTQDIKHEVPGSASSVDLGSVEGLNFRKQLCIKDNGDQANTGSRRGKKKVSSG